MGTQRRASNGCASAFPEKRPAFASEARVWAGRQLFSCSLRGALSIWRWGVALRLRERFWSAHDNSHHSRHSAADAAQILPFADRRLVNHRLFPTARPRKDSRAGWLAHGGRVSTQPALPRGNHACPASFDGCRVHRPLPRRQYERWARHAPFSVGRISCACNGANASDASDATRGRQRSPRRAHAACPHVHRPRLRPTIVMVGFPSKRRAAFRRLWRK